jgi:type II secretory pathway pseudopilin PulG
MYKIIGTDRKEYGPVTADQIRQLIASGRCDASTLVRVEGTKAWKPLILFKEFDSALGDAPKPSTTPPPAASRAFAAAPLTTKDPTTKNKWPYILAIAGAIVIGGFLVLGALAVIAIPSFKRARQQAQTNQCRDHLRQLGSALRTYAGNNGGRFPMANAWSDAISNQVSSATFKCPASTNKTFTCAYAFNSLLGGRNLKDTSPRAVMLFESDSSWNGSGGKTAMVARGHSAPRDGTVKTGEKVFHVVFVDGSFTSVPESGVSMLRWKP